MGEKTDLRRIIKDFDEAGDVKVEEGIDDTLTLVFEKRWSCALPVYFTAVAPEYSRGTDARFPGLTAPVNRIEKVA